MFKLLSLFFVLLFITSCMESGKSLRSLKKTGAKSFDESFPVGGDGAGSNSATTISSSNSTDTLIENGQVELRGIVDPETGRFEKKVTIPKDFNGTLVLSGLNFSSLATSGQFISVQFEFGKEYEKVVLPATVTSVEGITPEVDMQVLSINMNTKPFRNLRLLYDLYDYNDYWATGKSFQGDGSDPTNDPLNRGLFCRGLKLADDPTFVESGTSNKLCDSSGDVCLYAYAKVRDSGLYNTTTKLYENLEHAQMKIDTDKTSYSDESLATSLKKCLPDTLDGANLFATLVSGNITTPVAAPGSMSYGDTLTMSSGTSYEYRGPYNAFDESNWEISGGAMFSLINTSSAVQSGLFENAIDGSSASQGYDSFLFPRAYKIKNLRAGVDHFSSTGSFDTARALDNLLSPQDTNWMDGCNGRVRTLDDTLNEHMGSCTVTAKITIMYTELESKNLIEIATSKDVKIQLAKASSKDYDGSETIYSSLNKCESSSECGANSCCFNKKCWSKNYVSQCIEETSSTGNSLTGESCSTDFDCASLCCNDSTKTCSVHSNIGETPVLCSKPIGGSCISKEWCRKESVPKCKIIKTGRTPAGAVTCALRCYTSLGHGNCNDGICVPPTIEDPPTFDPAAPDCTQAIDPPKNQEEINNL